MSLSTALTFAISNIEGDISRPLQTEKELVGYLRKRFLSSIA
jgi:hypothetical protein